MIKRILLAICVISSNSTLAAEQYSQSRCDAIKAEREKVQDRMRAGYKAAEGERLRRRSTELFEILGRHCISPTNGRSYSSGSRTYTRSSANDLLNKKVHDSTVYSKTYDSDSKRLAWSSFYQYPERFRAKEMQQTDFVWCSENRAEQRAKFEAQWQAPSKASANVKQPTVVLSQQNTTAIPTITHSMTLTPVSKADTRLNTVALEKEGYNYKVWQLVAVGCLAFMGVFGAYRWFKD